MSGDLPTGWASAPVGELFSSHGGGTPSRGIAGYWNGNILWLSSGDIKAATISESSEKITKRGLQESTACLCRPGSVLVVVRSGILKHTLPIAILEREAAINQDIKAFDCGDDRLNRWLALAWRASARDLLSENREGTTVQSVKMDTLCGFDLHVPPLAEQKRIVAKVEKLLEKVDASRARLDKVSALLKRFRQSVLAAACSGRLTTDWRMRNPIDTRCDDLVARIRNRREKHAKTPAQQVKLRDIYSITEEESTALPDGWGYVALSKICESFDYGTSAKSKPSGKVPVLRMGNIQNGCIDWNDLVYTSDAQEILAYSLKPNTVLFNRTNSPELVGKTSIYLGERPAIFAGYLIRVNHCPELDPRYLNMCLNTNYARAFCQSVKTDGVSQSNINAQKLGHYEVPYPPISEQLEIVRRVEEMFALADRLEARVGKARGQVDKLTQSILAKAFRGELVPQDPNDEPAERLLARIRAKNGVITAKGNKANSLPSVRPGRPRKSR